jgi:nitrate reductase beta subunit
MAEKFHLTDTNGAAPPEKNGRVNLLNWDGQSTNGLFPDRSVDLEPREPAPTPGRTP